MREIIYFNPRWNEIIFKREVIAEKTIVINAIFLLIYKNFRK